MATKGQYIYDYPRPMLTADCMVVNDRNEVLLVRRGNEPYKGCWALPGGFMEMDETLEHTAVRELEEETGLKVYEQDIRLIGVYSTLDRDPRGRTVTTAYAVSGKWKAAPRRGTEHLGKEKKCSEESGKPVVGDDAAEVRWWPLGALPPLAFDHAEIVAEALDSRNILPNKK